MRPRGCGSQIGNIFCVRNHRVGTIILIALFISFSLYKLRHHPAWSANGKTSQCSRTIGDQSPEQPRFTPIATYLSQSRTNKSLPMPSDYEKAADPALYCAERFGRKYLHNFGHSSKQYCNSQSASGLTCFHSQTAAGGRVDSFCIGGPAKFDEERKRFELDCLQRTWTPQDVTNGTPRLEDLPRYWYQTGPRFIMDRYLELEAAGDGRAITFAVPRGLFILVKRENTTDHLWHALMEIFSLFMTFDVLQMTRDPATNTAFFETLDIENAQIVILDDQPEGPYFDLWTAFTKKPVIRINDISSLHRPIIPSKVLLPLPGGSNPFWQGDWEVLPCERSELLQVFSQRVLDFYQVDGEESEAAVAIRPLKLTFIDRMSKRRLIDKEFYIRELKSKFPTVDIDLVDFAIYPFAEQLRIVRQTDILVGVHGAGLAHAMFLPRGSTVVEILPHSLNHKGFRNLANMLGHQYFCSHAAAKTSVALATAPTTTEDWQRDDVFLEQDRFMELLSVAIKSVYNSGLRNDDVI